MPTSGLRNICGEIEMKGVAAESYSDREMCVADIANLREGARRDGIDRCQSLCKDLGCEALDMAFRRFPAATCKVRNAETFNSYGISDTGQFVCVCVTPPQD